jgi:hypothetical protein
MGCGACGAKSALATNYSRTAPAYRAENVGPCDFSKAMVNDFHDRLTWFRETASFRKYNILPKVINKHLGNVKSALNTTNVCLFRVQLEAVSELIDFIISVQDV